jgi:hypothetical protein
MTIRRSCLMPVQASAAPPRSNANRIVGTHKACEPGAVVRRRRGRGRQLLLPRSQVRLATAPGGTREARSLDHPQAGVNVSIWASPADRVDETLSKRPWPRFAFWIGTGRQDSNLRSPGRRTIVGHPDRPFFSDPRLPRPLLGAASRGRRRQCPAEWWALRLILGVYSPLSIAAMPSVSLVGLCCAMASADK